MSGEGMLPSDPRPPAPTGISGEQLEIVRVAVADTHRASGLAHLVERTLAGELDAAPMIQAAALAVERVLRGQA